MCYHRMWIFDSCGHTILELKPYKLCKRAKGAQKDHAKYVSIAFSRLHAPASPTNETQVSSRLPPMSSCFTHECHAPPSTDSSNLSLGPQSTRFQSDAEDTAYGRVSSSIYSQATGSRIASSIYSFASSASERTVSQATSQTTEASPHGSPTFHTVERLSLLSTQSEQAVHNDKTVARAQALQALESTESIDPEPQHSRSCDPAAHPFLTRRVSNLCQTCSIERAARLAAIDQDLEDQAPRFDDWRWRMQYQKDEADDGRKKLWRNKTSGVSTPVRVKSPGGPSMRGALGDGVTSPWPQHVEFSDRGVRKVGNNSFGASSLLRSPNNASSGPMTSPSRTVLLPTSLAGPDDQSRAGRRHMHFDVKASVKKPLPALPLPSPPDSGVDMVEVSS